MTIHFSADELAARRRATCDDLAARGLDALLCFRQESMYYLTGYDTFGYVFFQCFVLTADGRMALLTRAPDLRQAQRTSVIDDIRIWIDGPDADPAVELRALAAELVGDGRRLGVEYEAYGLTARNGRRLEAAFAGRATLVDASDLVSRRRMVKSDAELAYVRRAAELADDALDAAHATARAGVDEGEILAAMHAAIYRGGGDDPANEFVIGSGPDALLTRYHSGRRRLDARDQLTLEWAGAYRHYHAALMRTIPVGSAPPEQVSMHAACVEAMAACLDALRPGRPLGEVFDAYARVLDAHGHRANRFNATGYGLGTTFAPNWMDYPMLFHGQPEPAQPGMVLFLHMVCVDSARGLAMAPGHTVVVTDTGSEPLSRRGLELHVA